MKKKFICLIVGLLSIGTVSLIAGNLAIIKNAIELAGIEDGKYAKDAGNKTIMAFRWDGTPVASIKVPGCVGNICADLDNKVLYAVDVEKERLLKWTL